ncbi:lipoprotein LppK [Mycobacterium tuberculosis]|nr:lipoprotein LppK [Mycobacterium tuberculosis]
MTAKSLATGVVGDAAISGRPPPRLLLHSQAAGSRACRWMRRNIRVTLGAATIVAALGLSGCSHPEFKRSSPPAPSLPPVTSSPLEAAPITPLPAPEALIDVLSRLAGPAVPGTNKVQLIEGATPENAAALDRFTTALRDGSYLPMTFAANDIAWSDNKPSDVMATVVVTTAHPDNREFTFPMEFVSFKGGWQLSRQTAEMLLAMGNSPDSTPSATSPAPAPSPTPPG